MKREAICKTKAIPRALVAVPLALSLATPCANAVAEPEEQDADGHAEDADASLLSSTSPSGEALASQDKDVISARERVSAAEKNLDAAQEAYEAQAKESEQARSALEDAKTANSSAQKRYQGEKEAFAAAAKSDSEAQASLDEANARCSAIADGSAAKAVTEAEKKAETAARAQEGAQAAYDAAEADAGGARQKLSEGAFAFFADMGATEALAVLNCESQKTYNGTDAANLTAKGSGTDATSVENMQAALSYIAKCNELRAAEGLDALEVSFERTAYAMFNANWSDSNQAHANVRAFQSYENLAWGTSDPFDAWYTQEKAIAEAAQPYAIDTAFKDYKNIVSKDNVVTGYAVNTKGTLASNCHSEVFGNVLADGEKTYALDEYGAMLTNWTDGLKKTIETAREKGSALDAAKATTESAEEDAAQARAYADAAYANAQLAAAQNKKAQTAEVLNASDEALLAAQAKADAAQRAQDEAQAAFDAASADDEKQAMEDAQAELAAANAALDAAEAPYSFADVDYSLYYGPTVAAAAKDGLMSGYSGSTNFGPEDVMTRGQLATVLWRLSCPDEAAAYDMGAAVNESAFPDVEDGKYYTAAANWAAEKGVINGFEEGGHREFKPYEPVTMEQLCCIVANFRGESYGANNLAGQAVEGFVDGQAVSPWAAGSVSWAAKHGWVNGYEAGGGARELRPGEALARGRAATILENSGVLSAHEHEWVEATGQVWVPNVVVVQEAYDEPVYESKAVHYCGVCETPMDENHGWEVHISKGDYSYWGYVKQEKVQTGTIHHDAVTEDQGRYEDKVTGYVCAGCGERKE